MTDCQAKKRLKKLDFTKKRKVISKMVSNGLGLSTASMLAAGCYNHPMRSKTLDIVMKSLKGV